MGLMVYLSAYYEFESVKSLVFGVKWRLYQLLMLSLYTSSVRLYMTCVHPLLESYLRFGTFFTNLQKPIYLGIELAFYFLFTCFTMVIFCCCCLQVNYGNFMHGLMKENIQLNSKVLSELSMHEPYSVKALVDISRNAFSGNKNVLLAPKKEGISIVAW